MDTAEQTDTTPGQDEAPAPPLGPPRRYGVNEPNFDPEVGCRIRVTLGGTEIENVLSYDVDLRMVETYQVDPETGIKVDWVKGQAKTCRMFGDVKAEWK